MTRLFIAVMTVVGLSVGALHVPAQHAPSADGEVACLDGDGPICKEVTTTTCERWEVVGAGGSSAGTVGVKVECTKKTVTTSTYRYDS